jgi:hypothetical protein
MVIEPIQVRLLASIKHFPPDSKAYPATHHSADQIQFILMARLVAMGFADVNHVNHRNCPPELRVSGRSS